MFIMLMLLIAPVLAVQDETALSAQTSDYSKIPFKPEPQSSSDLLSKVFLVMMISIVLIIGVLFLMKKTLLKQQGIFNGQRIHLCDIKRLSPKLSVFLIKIDKQEYIVLQTANSAELHMHTSLTSNNDTSVENG